MTAAELQLQVQAPRVRVDSTESRPSSRAEHDRRPAAPEGDFLSTPMPLMLLMVTGLPFIMLTLWLVFIYVGIEYRAPAINTQSVPPPLMYEHW